MSTDIQSCDFTIRVEELDKAVLITLVGELDITAVPQLITEMRVVVAHGEHPVILDVRELSYIDSAGLAVIASMRVKLVQNGRRLLAVGCHGILQKIMRITQLDRELPCFANVDDALHSAAESSH